MEGEGWWPINSTFYANSYEEGYGKAVSLDGNSHVIKNLTIAASKDNEFETGFFGALVGSVTNLGLYNATVDGGNTQNAGILAGILGTEENAAVVDKCYVNGKLVANGAAGAIAGMTGEATVSNVYANANISGEGIIGDFIGIGSPALTIINSYSAGKANGSQATAGIADNQGCSTQNFLFYGIQNQQEICDIAYKWEGWNEDGTIGMGWPLLDWQVQRGDYAKLCGFGKQGDLNNDGKIDIADAVTVLNIMAEGVFNSAADVNGDKKVDIADFVTILNIMAEQ
jgi:hypothetical protein